ncbi:hypothetical protein CAP36_07860 [Chitinophagaceae bacterium IBVUCB2]|nr:hypothetical protein CAP36_07860 [Chitinophagaceae bacterium IBVUCB2]
MNSININARSNPETGNVTNLHSVEDKTIVTFAEAANWLGLSHSSLYKMTSDRKLPYYKPGGKRIFFKMEELKAWVLSNRTSSLKELQSNSTIKNNQSHGNN